MQIGDTRYIHLVSDQGVVKDQEKKARAQTDEQQVDDDRYAAEEGPPQLMDPQKMMSLVKQKTFDLGDVQSTVDELRQAKGFRGSEAELKQIGKELKAIHGDITKDGWENIAPDDKKRLEWVNLAQAGVKSSLEGIRQTGRNIHWENISAGHGGEIPQTYELYFKDTNVPADEMKEILQTADDLHRTDSKMKLGGNNVTPLMKGDIWATKMRILDDAAANPVKDGKPIEISAEYYEMDSPEMVGRLRKVAENGGKVRVVLDPGHLTGAGKDTFDASSIAIRMGVTEQLKRGMDGKDMGVALYPNREQLGGRDEIMHRKIFRAGEEVVFGGTNANQGSGENVDFGMKIEGPASRRIGEIFREDAETSRGKGVEEIYGDQLDLIRGGDKTIKLSGQGLEGLLSSAYAGKALLTGAESREEKVDRLIAAAKMDGVNVADLGEFSDLDKDGKASSGDVRRFLLSPERRSVTLNGQGREFLAARIESTVDGLKERGNVDKMGDVNPPGGKVPDGVQGKDVLAVGSTSVERQALVLDAISSADKFIKVSAFVVNDDIAKLLVEKKREKEARGEDFQVQVIMDPGLYSYGGTPNEAAFKRLEDGGVPVKWSLLDRTDPSHDRKNHSKLMITDKMVLSGSTNFSTNGLRNNWEDNDAVYFNENDPESMKKQQAVVGDFDRMWKREAIGIDSAAISQKRYENYQGVDKDIKIDRYRTTILRSFCQGIESYEREIGGRLQQAGDREDIKAAVAQRVSTGENSGYALLSSIPPDQLDQMRIGLPAWKKLQAMRAGAIDRQ